MFPPIDPRDEQLAKLLVGYSTRVKRGELVFISCNGLDTIGLGAACVREVVAAGAAPYVQINEPQILRSIQMKAKEHVFQRIGKFELKQMKDADVFIGIRGPQNSFELSDVPPSQMALYSKHIVKPVHLEERVKRTRWVVLRYPNPAMSQMAQMSTDGFAEFYYRVCLTDYAKMARAVKPLQKLMQRTDKVHITGRGTDLRFSIKGIPAVPCVGDRNVPDGECFSAPVRTSIEGTVQFNAPTLEEGFGFENVFLRFEKGRIVEARAANATQTKRLNQILDKDPGARYVGEFSLAFHPHILTPMRDILFDEKIAGSFHMAMGQCYDEANNGNKSAEHWDMVCIQRPEYGGGEIRFDGKLIRKDGEFVLPELTGLNRKAFGAK